MRFARSSYRHELNGLRTRKQISLYVERENARRARAERRNAEAQVRHLNFELITRVVLLVLAIGVGISVIVGVLGDASMLELSLLASSAWAAVAGALLRLLRPRSG